MMETIQILIAQIYKHIWTQLCSLSEVMIDVSSHRVLRPKVGELALLQDHHVLPDGVQVSHDLQHGDFLRETHK